MENRKDILKRFTSDEYSFKDYSFLCSSFKEEHKNGELKSDMKESWDMTASSGNQQNKLNQILDQLHHQININKQVEKSRIKMLYLKFSRVAAILFIPALIIIATLSFLSINKLNTIDSWAEIHSPAGSRTQFQLPDGSTGWLNSGSSIKYPINFRNNRRVEIEGEAWFDVVHISSSDFKVITPYFDVKVLGTQFNVLAYKDDPTVEVILEEGKVQILGKDNSVKGELDPDQHCIYNKAEHNIVKTQIDSKAYTSWKEGILIFKNSHISDIAKRLSRKYNTDIEILGESSDEAIFRATFQDESLDDICKLLATVAPVGYKIIKRVKLPDGNFTKNKVEMWLIDE